MTTRDPQLYGLMVEFLRPEEVVAAARRAHLEGYRNMDAYSPFPVEGLAEAIGFTRNRVPVIVFLGGLCGGILAYLMQWFSATVHYRLDIGGRPYHSWPAFIPITFELTVLGAAIAAVFGLLAMCGLPRPYHPVFNVPNFVMASRSRFFLCILANDPKFEPAATRAFLESLAPKDIAEVLR
jgi:hypothetical protein